MMTSTHRDFEETAAYTAWARERARRPLVLVAFKDEMERREVAKALRWHRYRPVCVSSGTDLVDFLALAADADNDKLKVSLVICGLDLGSVSALDVLATMKSAHWNIPLILMLEIGERVVRDSAYEAGAFAVFPSDVDGNDLMTAVFNAVWFRELDTRHASRSGRPQ